MAKHIAHNDGDIGSSPIVATKAVWLSGLSSRLQIYAHRFDSDYRFKWRRVKLKV